MRLNDFSYFVACSWWYPSTYSYLRSTDFDIFYPVKVINKVYVRRGFVKPEYVHRTNKSTKRPVRFKGYIGGR